MPFYSCPCPFCGPRAEIEFRYGGETHIERPSLDVDDAGWADYLFYRTNPKGEHAERWLHEAGCRRWFNMVRDTLTHDIIHVYPMGSPRPQKSDAQS